MKRDKRQKTFMRWPLYMTVFLAVMTGVIYAIDPRAGIVAGIATAVYGLAAVAAYTYSRPVVHKELVSFATQYGQIQKRLLKELFIPYALLDGDGRILWYNEEFQKIEDPFQSLRTHASSHCKMETEHFSGCQA